VRVAVIIPALDEEDSIGAVVRGLVEALVRAGDEPVVVVADNGSRDQTALEAGRAGALVVAEPVRGYGAACLAALAALPADVDAVLFADGDGADDPSDVEALLAPLRRARADLVIGSRTLGERFGLVEPGSLTPVQRFGNRLATTLLRVLLLHAATDLGPFRAVTKKALDDLGMDDRGFGWTIQMQARAARLRLRVLEVPVRYRRRRSGRSKISGNLKEGARAGAVILRTLGREALAPKSLGRPPQLRRPGHRGDADVGDPHVAR
jgi:glycosyltransferase involved in cell wall biosynthesis